MPFYLLTRLFWGVFNWHFHFSPSITMQSMNCFSDWSITFLHPNHAFMLTRYRTRVKKERTLSLCCNDGSHVLWHHVYYILPLLIVELFFDETKIHIFTEINRLIVIYALWTSQVNHYTLGTHPALHNLQPDLWNTDHMCFLRCQALRAHISLY